MPNPWTEHRANWNCSVVSFLWEDLILKQSQRDSHLTTILSVMLIKCKWIRFASTSTSLHCVWRSANIVHKLHGRINVSGTYLSSNSLDSKGNLRVSWQVWIHPIGISLFALGDITCNIGQITSFESPLRFRFWVFASVSDGQQHCQGKDLWHCDLGHFRFIFFLDG